MTPSDLHCGILGTGAFAHVHAEAIAAVPEIALTAVSDADLARATTFAERWKAKAEVDVDALLGHELDIITIATPNDTHTDYIRQILDHPHAPKLLIVEKPLCVSPEELEEIATLLKKSKTHLVVDHSRRFNAGFMRLRGLIKQKTYGNVLSVHWRYYAGWFHVGSHAVDTLRMLIGNLDVLHAERGPVDRFEDDPLLHVTLRSEDFPKASIFLEGIPEQPYALFEADMLFEEGRMQIQWDDLFVDHLQPNGHHAPILTFHEHFRADAVTTALTTMYTWGADLLHKNDQRLLEAAGFSVARGTMDILFDARSKI